MATGAISALGAGAAQADNVHFDLLSISPDPIVVVSNGQNYTQLQGNTPVIIETRAFLDVEVTGSIVSWWVQPSIQTGVGIATDVGGMWFSRHTESYPYGNRPDKVNKIIDLSVAASTLEDAAVSMCETIASGLRFNGMSNAQIFGQDRQAHFKVGLAHDQNLNVPGSNQIVIEGQPPVELGVICKAFAPPSLPGSNGGIASSLLIESAAISLMELPTKTGKCQVRTSLTVQSNKANTQINYRYVHSGGAISQTYGAITDQNGDFNVLRVWDIPKVQGTETGWFKVEGVSANFATNQAAYEMECQSTLGIDSGSSGTPGRDIISR